MSSNTRGCLDSVKFWLFAPCAEDEDEVDFPNYSEKRGVYYDQPRPTTPIRAAPSRSISRGRLQQRQFSSGSVDDMGWLDKYFFSRRRKTTRRPPISISRPMNFQHTGTGAVNFRTSVQSFRPLQLSIYEPNNRVSPLLPYFIGPNPDLALPEPARTHGHFDDDGTTLHSRTISDNSFHIPRRPVGDGASYTSSSFFEDSPPRIPPRAKTRPRAHTHSYTSPSVEAIVTRIASAIIEKDILDAEIHSLKSRTSMCLSRPSTAYDLDEPVPFFPLVPPSAPSFAERVSIDRPRTAPATQSSFRPPPPSSTQAVPSVPTVPPRRTRSKAPPFPERRSSFKAPPWKPNQVSRSASAPAPDTPSRKQAAVPASALHSHPPLDSPRIIDNSIDISVPLAPPLPLILRPPLRKKKSFSRVSDWLFPADMDKDISNSLTGTGAPHHLASFAAHKRAQSSSTDINNNNNNNAAAVTNAPRALTDKEGFYQTLPNSALFSGPRRSFDSSSQVSRPLSTESIYSTDEEQGMGYPGTVATSQTHWSPGSTPPEEVRRQADCWRQNEAGLRAFAANGVVERVGTFGSHASETDRGSPEVMSEEEVEEVKPRVMMRRVPMHVRQASLQAPAPRPTSVGVAF